MHGSIGVDPPAPAERPIDGGAAMGRVVARDALFAQFARHSSNALWIADAASGRFLYLNPAAERIWAAGAAASLHELNVRLLAEDRDRIAGQRARVVAGMSQQLSYRLGDGAIVRRFRETSFSIPATATSAQSVAGIVQDMSSEIPVYLVAEPRCGPATADALDAAGVRCKHFAADEFLRIADSLVAGCVVVDLCGLSRDAAHYTSAIKSLAARHPLVLIGDKDATQSEIIGALKAGAIDYLLHPPHPDALATAVAAAQRLLPDQGGQWDVGTAPASSLPRLPRREHEVLVGLMGGGTNKTIGRTLGISPRTVEAHRAHLMDRLNVRTLTDLVRVAIASGFRSGSRDAHADAANIDPA